MPNFDLDTVLRARAETAGARVQKMNDVLQARQEKVNSLGAENNVIVNPIDPYQDSWVRDLGMNPNSVAGELVNLGASVFSGAARVAGDIASLPWDVAAVGDDQGLAQPHFDAYGRWLNGTASEADDVLLNTRDSGSGLSPMERIARANLNRQRGSAIDQATDFTPAIHGGNRDELVGQLRQGFQEPWNQVKQGWEEGGLSGAADVVSGLGQLAGQGIKAAVQNPLGAAEFVAENAPQLAVAMLPGGQGLLAASNLGYGAELYRKGVDNYQKEHGGQLPGEAERRDMMMWAGAAVAAEQAGDLSTLALGGVLKRAASKVDVAELRTGAKQALLGIGKAGIGGTLTEAATEGFQTYAEGRATLDEATPEEIYEGAVIGGIAGGAMAGGVRTAAEALGATPAHAAQRANQAQKSMDLAQAIITGDASAYTDPRTPEYDPIQAAFILHQHSKRPDLTAEQRQQKFQEGLDLVQGLAAQFEGADEAKTRELLAKQTGLFEKLHAFKADKDKLDAEQGKVTTPAVTPEEVQAVVETAAAPATPEAQPVAARAAQQVVSMAMTEPDKLTPEQIQAVADNPDNGLSEQQRSFLRTFTAARAAENEMKTQSKVADEVLNGGKGFIGINQYRERFTLARDAGHLPVMNQQIEGLNEFLASHADKAKVAQEALAAAREISPRNPGFYVLKTKGGGWVMQPNDGSLSKKQLTKVGGLQIHPGSGGIVAGIQSEAKAIEAVRNELVATRDLVGPVQPAAPAQGGQVATAPTAAAAPSVPAAQPVPAPAAATPEREARLRKFLDQGYKPQRDKSGRMSLVKGNGSIVLEPGSDAIVERILAEQSQSAAAVPDVAQAFARVFNTDELFNRWSNTRTPDDRANMVRQIEGAAKSYLPHATEANRQALYDELMNQKWFKQASEEQRQAGVNALIAANAPASSTVFEDAEALGVGYQWGTDEDVLGAQQVVSLTPALAARTTVRLATPDEQVIYARVLSELDEVFSDVVDPTVFLIHDSDRFTDGMAMAPYAQFPGIITLDAKLFSKDSKVRAVLAHELAHLRDELNKDDQGRWASDRAAAYQPGGKLFEEAKASMAKDPKLERGLSWVFTNPNPEANPDHNVARELYAQLHSLYINQPALMRQHLPQSYDAYQNAYALYDRPQDAGGDANRADRGGVDESRARDDARGSRGGSQEQARPDAQRAEPAESVPPARGAEGEVKAPADDDLESLVAEVEASDKPLVVKPQPEVAEGPEAPVTVVGAGELKDEGTLEVFARRLKADGGLHALWKTPGFNPVAQFFKQTPTGENQKTRKPLVAVKDFFEQFKDKGFVKQLAQLNLVQGELTIEQEMAVRSLATVVNQWIPQLQANLADYDQLKSKSGKPLHPDFKTQDLMQFLLKKDEQGNTLTEVENNVAGAMGAAMYSWILDRANAPATLKREQINDMHGYDKDSPLGEGAEAALNRLHSFESTVIDQLGGLAVQLLGVVEDKGAPQDLMPRLKNALGSHMLLLLEKDGYIDRVQMLPEQVDRFFPEKKTEDDQEGAAAGNPYATEKLYRYVRFVHAPTKQGYWELPPGAKAIRDVNQGTAGIVDKLMGSDRAPRIAATEPQEFTQQFAKGTTKRIPGKLKRVLQKTQEIPHYVIPEMLDLALGMGTKALLTAAGHKDLSEGAPIAARNVDSVKAQNDNLRNQLHLALEMMGLRAKGDDAEAEIDALPEDLDKAKAGRWFTTAEVWKNFRVGFTTQSLNQQTSKIHRTLFAREGWEAEIDLENDDQVREFLISAHMNLGMKTDAQTNDQSMATMESWFEKEHGGRMKEALRVIREGDWTPANQELVGQVAAKAEGMLTLQALVALGKFQDAAAKGETKVKVHMLVGADGKTNGPMLTHFALGAADGIDGMYLLLNRGGFYSTDEGQAGHFSQWKSTPDANGKKQLDLYEHLASLVLARMKDKIHSLDEIKAGWRERKRLADSGRGEEAGKLAKKLATWFTPEQYAAVEVVTKQLQKDNGDVAKAGRNLVKTPLTGFAFGSALKGSVQSMAGKFVDTIFEDIEELARGTRDDGVDLPALLGAVNVLIELGGGKDHMDIPRLAPNMPIEKALEIKLTPAQEKAIMAGFNKVVGNSTQEAMETAFAAFIERRRTLNKTIQVAFHTYDVAYKAARQQLFDTLMASGEIAYRESKQGGKTVREPLHDLTLAQERQLRERLSDLLPAAHTAYSQEQGDIAMGLSLAKRKKKQSDSVLYKNKVYVADGVHNLAAGPDGGLVDKQDQFLDSASQVKEEVDPGVAGTPYFIHSLDSFVMHSMLDEIFEGIEGANPLNVHDEASTSYANIAKVAQSLNKQTVLSMLDFSPARQVAQMMERQVVGLAARVKEGSLPKEAALALRAAWTKAYNNKTPAMLQIEEADALSFLMRLASRNAYEADKLRLMGVAKLGVSDQYTWEGGQYVVEQEVRDRAVQALVQLELQGTTPTQEFQDAIAFLDGIATDGKDVAELDYKAWLDKDSATENAEEDRPVLMKGSAWLGVPGVNGAQVIEELAQANPDVPTFQTVRMLLAEGQSLTQALNALPPEHRAAVIQAASREAQNRPQERFNPWGEVGAPVRPGNERLTTFLALQRDVSVEQLAPVLEQALRHDGVDGPFAKFNLLLLGQLRKVAPKSLRIKYVTPDTDASEILDAPADRSRGWTVARKEGVTEIYILSPDFVHSAIEPELLLHEILHGVLGRTIAEAQAGRGTKEAQSLVQELEGLREQVQEFLNSGNNESLKFQFGPAVANVQELVSWGMTNQAFQQEVLAKLHVRERTNRPGSNSLVDWFQSFIKKLLALVFPDNAARNKQAHSGLTVLVSNASGLIAQVKNDRAWPTGQDQEFNLSQVNPLSRPWRYTTEELFDALGTQHAAGIGLGRQISAAFSDKLKGTLGMVGQLFGPGGVFKANAMGQVAMTPLDVWAKARATGELPFASTVPAFLALHPQEQFTLESVEATLRAALEDNEARTAIAYGELAKLYKEAHAQLKRSDFADPALYDFAFGVQATADGRSNYLARFAALALAHEDFNKALAALQPRPSASLSGLTFEGKLRAILSKAIDWFTGRMTRARPGEPMDRGVARLAQQLVDIEAKKRLRIARAGQPNTSAFAALEQATADAAEKAKAAVAAAAGSDIVRKARSGVVRGAGAVTRVVANDQMKEFMDGVMKLRDETMKKRHGWIASLVGELRGLPQDMQALITGVKQIEKERSNRITDMVKAVSQVFDQGGAYMSQEQKAAVTQVFLRSGAHALLATTEGMEHVRELVADAGKRDHAIRQAVGALTEFKDQVDYFVNQSKDLGFYKASGLVKGDYVLMNAGNIARLHGTHQAGRLTVEQSRRAEVMIDQLATLYALEYMDDDKRALALEVLDHELARADRGNGVEAMLRIHQALEAESRARLFDGTETMLMKGYVPEIYNHHTAIAVGRDADEIQSLKEQGYSQGAPLEQDVDDPHAKDGQPQLFVLKDGGLQPRVTGSMSLTGQAARGTKLYGGKNNFFDPDALQNMVETKRINKARQAKIAAKFKHQPGYDPRKVKGNHMAPVLDARGDVKGWRYLMSEATKDKILERDNRPEHVLGAMAGSIYDKATTPTHNREVVQALKDLYDADYASRPGSYARIAANSPDADLREIYRLIPDETQDAIRAIWGKSGMFVPYELLDAVFGYRKLSLSQPFDKDREGMELNMAEKGLVEATRGALYAWARGIKHLSPDEAREFSGRGAVYLRRVERAWQEIVKEMKDMIVVKSGVTMIGNVKSNMSLLLLKGVSPKDIAYHHKVAIKGALAYQRDRAALAQLQIKLNAGYARADEEEIERQIAILQDSISRNPVKELIDAGLMPTIVEDVALEDDPYSYKSQLERKVQGLTEKVNPVLLKAGKYAYMTHDTPLYQSLSQITQLSDFVARYTLYQHLVSRKKNKLSKADAIHEAVESFISYDVPMHRGLQYMDDHGLMMFTKYVLRIQRVLAKLVKEHPARVLMGLLLSRYFNNLDLVIEGSWFHRVGSNPLSAGALEYPFNFDELATSRAALGLIPGG